MGDLYDQDLVLWSEEQGRALRAAAGAGWNAPIDWENVAEEIESLGRSERHALASHIAIVIEHLLKLQASPATEPARGWRDTIRRARRRRLRRCWRKVPACGAKSPTWSPCRHRAHAALVRANLQDYGEQPRIDIASVTYTEAQVLGDWLPDND